LHTEYRRASDEEALIDLAINTTTGEGKELLHAAALGDFRKALAQYNPDVVRLRQGRLSHNLVKENTLSVNVIGWHSGWHYQGLERLILHTDQQIVPDAAGGLTVYTTLDLTKERDRKKNHERTST